MKRILLSLLLSITTLPAFSQREVDWRVVRLIDSAKNLLCTRDTVGAIRKLEMINRQFPNDAHIVLTNKVLGDLYLRQRRTDEAIVTFRNTLCNWKAGPYVNPSDTKCDTLFTSFLKFPGPAGICVSLSQAFLKKKLFDSSLHYLNLADDPLLPYQGCVNGILLSKTYLSLFYANTYLAKGDTSKAIERLFDFLLVGEGYSREVASKLRTMLRYSYSQTYINEEIDRGIENAKIVPGSDGKTHLAFYIFEHKFLRRAGDRTLAQWKRYLASEDEIRILKGALKY